MKKLMPLALLLIGAGAGVGAGIYMRPSPEAMAQAAQARKASEKDPELEYVKMNNQFVVPVVKDERVASLVVMSLSLEVTEGQSDEVYAREPKIRDSFLQVMFNHANIGGFDGEFTNSRTLEGLRRELHEVARQELGNQITDVLIVEIARQDY